MAVSYKTSHHTLFALILALMVLYRHRENIKRLREGKESKLGETIKKS
jgi:glycerol-3-phosphate acyltransferase PlsY